VALGHEALHVIADPRGPRRNVIGLRPGGDLPRKLPATDQRPQRLVIVGRRRLDDRDVERWIGEQQARSHADAGRAAADDDDRMVILWLVSHWLSSSSSRRPSRRVK